MPSLNAFHEVRFPTDIALGSAGGPQRRTEVVTLGSGHEQRNARWSSSRRRYNAGYGVKTLDDLAGVIAFFEQRRGRLFGFRFRDPIDHKSCRPGRMPDANDQLIGTGDGITQIFQLTKLYGEGEGEWIRNITKPVQGTVLIQVNGALKTAGTDFSVDHLTGMVTFDALAIPGQGEEIRAGFEFDVPVRFDADEITLNMTNFLAGDIPSIPLVEVLL